MTLTPHTVTSIAVPTTDTDLEDDCPPPLVGVSASSIETFQLCVRKWAWWKIAGVKAPENAAAAKGNKIHKILEHYIQTGSIDHSDPELGAIASSGTHLIPPVVHEIETSYRFLSPTIPHVVYRGRKDLVVHPWVYDASGVSMPGRGRPLIGDHKTTSSISQWAKSIDVLRTDVQLGLYAKSEMDRWDCHEIDARWIYYQTKGTRKAEARDLTLTRAEVEKVFANLELTASKIAAIVQQSRAEDTHPNDTEQRRRRNLRVLSLPYTSSACSAYGGCAYQGYCNLSPSERMGAILIAPRKTIMQTGPISFAAQAVASAQPATMTHAPNGMPLPPSTIESGIIFDPASNGYYNVAELHAQHGLEAITPLLNAAAMRHAASPAAAPVAPPPAMQTPVPAFAMPPQVQQPNYQVNPPEGPNPNGMPVGPTAAPQTSPTPPTSSNSDGEELTGMAAIKAKIQAEVQAGTFMPSAPYARTTDPMTGQPKKGKRTNAEIEHDLRWQKTIELGLAAPQQNQAPQPTQASLPSTANQFAPQYAAPSPSAQPQYGSQPIVAASGPLPSTTPDAFVAQDLKRNAFNPTTQTADQWLEDHTKYARLSANALANYMRLMIGGSK